MNELGNTPADKNYKPSGISRAEERALETYPNENFIDHTYAEMCRGFYEEGYEQAEKDLTDVAQFSSGLDGFFYGKGYKQAEKDIIAIVKEYVEKGLRCMEQSDKFQMHTFWDGFHNCAENILRELEDEK